MINTTAYPNNQFPPASQQANQQTSQSGTTPATQGQSAWAGQTPVANTAYPPAGVSTQQSNQPLAQSTAQAYSNSQQTAQSLGQSASQNYSSAFKKLPNFSLSSFNLQSFFSGSLVPKILVVLLIAGGVYFLPNLFSTFFGAKPTITVIGQGTYDFTPDTVSMTVALVTTGSDPIKTIDNGDNNTKVLIDTAKSIAGQGAEIKRAFYQAQPIAGTATNSFQVINAFSLKFNQIEKTSEMIKTLYDSGATTVSNVVFSVDSSAKLEQEARKLAVKDAREKARDLVQASGKRLGKLITISDDNQGLVSNISSVSEDGADLDNMAITKSVSVMYEMW